MLYALAMLCSLLDFAYGRLTGFFVDESHNHKANVSLDTAVGVMRVYKISPSRVSFSEWFAPLLGIKVPSKVRLLLRSALRY